MQRENDLLVARSENPVREPLLETGLYHSFRMPDGCVLRGAIPIDVMESRFEAFRLPGDLTGLRVLDIGSWAGYFVFEAERRGADVTAIDYADLDTFRALHRALGSRADYRRMDVYELDPARHGSFDIVLCLGLLYHLKHPLLALEKACAVTLDLCIVESFVVDGEAWLNGVRTPVPYLEFYEYGELGGQLDNWCGPTVSAVVSLARAAGFASAEVLRVTAKGAIVAAHRKWKDLPADSGERLKLLSINCHSHRGRSFQSQKEEYIALWCEWHEPEAPSVDTVFPEVSGFGVAPLSCTRTGNGLLISVRVPPGLAEGPHKVRVKIGDSQWSNCLDLFMDLDPAVRTPLIVSAQDGMSWEPGRVDWGTGGWLTLWAEGLSPEADPGNTIVEIDDIPHFPQSVIPETGQINVRLRPVIEAGSREVKLHHRGQASEARTILVAGDAPGIQGLESLRVSNK